MEDRRIEGRWRGRNQRESATIARIMTWTNRRSFDSAGFWRIMSGGFVNKVLDGSKGSIQRDCGTAQKRGGDFEIAIFGRFFSFFRGFLKKWRGNLQLLRKMEGFFAVFLGVGRKCAVDFRLKRGWGFRPSR